MGKGREGQVRSGAKNPEKLSQKTGGNGSKFASLFFFFRLSCCVSPAPPPVPVCFPFSPLHFRNSIFISPSSTALPLLPPRPSSGFDELGRMGDERKREREIRPRSLSWMLRLPPRCASRGLLSFLLSSFIHVSTAEVCLGSETELLPSRVSQE